MANDEEMPNDEVNRKIAELRHEIGIREYYPQYTDDWNLAGPLLEEMVASEGLVMMKPGRNDYWILGPKENTSVAGTLTEAIARAWLAWKEKQK